MSWKAKHQKAELWLLWHILCQSYLQVNHQSWEFAKLYNTMVSCTFLEINPKYDLKKKCFAKAWKGVIFCNRPSRQLRLPWRKSVHILKYKRCLHLPLFTAALNSGHQVCLHGKCSYLLSCLTNTAIMLSLHKILWESVSSHAWVHTSSLSFNFTMFPLALLRS